jgi:hypothetical protein
VNPSLLILVATILCLYVLSFLSRIQTNELFKVLLFLFKNKKIANWLLVIIYLPGTFLHEVAHAVSATFLLLHVKEFSLWPKVYKDGIRLGYVSYIKKDFFRGILVGISPVFLGMGIFLLLAYFQIFSNGLTVISIIGACALFIVSTTMFSSKQDMKDLIFIVPVIMMLTFIYYLFPDYQDSVNSFFLVALDIIAPYMYDIFWYTIISIVLQLIVIMSLKITLFLSSYGK